MVRLRVFLLSPLLSRVCRMLGIAVLLLDNVRTKKVKKEWIIAGPILVGHYLRRALYFIAWRIISNPLVSVQTAYDPDSSSWAISVLNSYVCINKNKSSNWVAKGHNGQVNILNQLSNRKWVRPGDLYIGIHRWIIWLGHYPLQIEIESSTESKHFPNLSR